jgi:hypothetical protein
MRKLTNGFESERAASYTAVNSHMAGGVLELVKQLCRLKQVVSYGDFKPLLMNIDERVKRSELGCGDPTLGCRELWMTAFIQ